MTDDELVLTQVKQVAAVTEIYNDGITSMLVLIQDDVSDWATRQRYMVQRMESDIEELQALVGHIRSDWKDGYEGAKDKIQTETAVIRIYKNPEKGDKSGRCGQDESN